MSSEPVKELSPELVKELIKSFVRYYRDTRNDWGAIYVISSLRDEQTKEWRTDVPTTIYISTVSDHHGSVPFQTLLDTMRVVVDFKEDRPEHKLVELFNVEVLPAHVMYHKLVEEELMGTFRKAVFGFTIEDNLVVNEAACVTDSIDTMIEAIGDAVSILRVNKQGNSPFYYRLPPRPPPRK